MYHFFRLAEKIINYINFLNGSNKIATPTSRTSFHCQGIDMMGGDLARLAHHIKEYFTLICSNKHEFFY